MSPRRAMVPLAAYLLALPGCGARAPASAPPPTAAASPASPAATPAPVRAIGAGDPSGSVISREPWPFEDAQGQVIRTRAFSLYTTETHHLIVDRLPGFLEAALNHFTTALGPLPPPAARLDTFVMASRAQWQRLTLRMLGPAGVPVTYIERGGFTHAGRAYLFDIGAADTFSIASHEGWHQFSQSTFRQRLPLCLEEGVAAFMEGHRWLGSDVVFLGWANLERFDRLREAASRPGGLLTLDQLFDSSPGALLSRGQAGPLTYYAQCWAFVHFLREGENGAHSHGFRRLVADAAGGHLMQFVAARLKIAPGARQGVTFGPTPAQVIRAYIDPDLDRLQRAFDEFQRRIIRTGGRDAVIEGRSPLTTAGR
ncbi:MAG: hypothetical protein AB7K52_14090 [Phycisphaerales bacterium]